VCEEERTTARQLEFIGRSQISRWRSAGEAPDDGGAGGGAGRIVTGASLVGGLARAMVPQVLGGGGEQLFL
jgi:hypothetical protein